MSKLNAASLLLNDPRITTLAGSEKFSNVIVKLSIIRDKIAGSVQLTPEENKYFEDVIAALNNIHYVPMLVGGEEVMVRFGAPLAPGEHPQPIILEK